MVAQATIDRKATSKISVEEFEQFLRAPENHDRLFELIDGEIVEKMPTEEHGYIAGIFITKLNNFVVPRSLGIVSVEARHRMPNDVRNSLIPDVSFRAGRGPLVKEGAVPRMPDLAIEIQSPDDTVKLMREKADYCLANDAQLVWLVFPKRRYIEVYRPGEEMEIRFGSDLLDGGELLPGFTLSLVEILADPFEEQPVGA
jgi:Uma2 family endonuclease